MEGFAMYAILSDGTVLTPEEARDIRERGN
jgi:hypothetical protein